MSRRTKERAWPPQTTFTGAEPLEDFLPPDASRQVDLARELLNGIASGNPKVGELLPTEAEICLTSGLSRYAVRQAVQKLCDLGVVERRAGIGTRVTSSSPNARYTQVMRTLNDLTRYAQDTIFREEVRELLDREDVPPVVRAAEGVQQWCHIGGLRYEASNENEPIALVDFFLDKAFSRAAGLQNLTNQPVHRLVERHYRIQFSRVDQMIEGALIVGADATRLSVPTGSAGLRIIRSYYAGDRLIEVTVGLHPADRFSYSMSFELAARRD